MEIKKYIFIFILFPLVTSCSSVNENSRLKQITKSYLSKFESKKEIVLKRKDIEDINYPLLEIKTNGVLQRSLMLRISFRDGYANYLSGTGQTLTLEGAAITKTNGLDNELISLKISKNSPLVNLTKIENWPSKIKKSYGFLTPSYKIKNINFNCVLENHETKKIIIIDFEYKLTKVIETCSNPNLNFKNYYWVDNDGFVWKSDQWISPKGTIANLQILKKGI